MEEWPSTAACSSWELDKFKYESIIIRDLFFDTHGSQQHLTSQKPFVLPSSIERSSCKNRREGMLAQGATPVLGKPWTPLCRWALCAPTQQWACYVPNRSDLPLVHRASVQCRSPRAAFDTPLVTCQSYPLLVLPPSCKVSSSRDLRGMLCFAHSPWEGPWPTRARFYWHSLPRR